MLHIYRNIPPITYLTVELQNQINKRRQKEQHSTTAFPGLLVKYLVVGMLSHHLDCLSIPSSDTQQVMSASCLPYTHSRMYQNCSLYHLLRSPRLTLQLQTQITYGSYTCCKVHGKLIVLLLLHYCCLPHKYTLTCMAFSFSNFSFFFIQVMTFHIRGGRWC